MLHRDFSAIGRSVFGGVVPMQSNQNKSPFETRTKTKLHVLVYFIKDYWKLNFLCVQLTANRNIPAKIRAEAKNLILP
jgi:hypothetical protein